MASRHQRPRKWLREHVAVLLKAYEQFPVLYESKCEDYYDRTKRDAALATIAQEVSVYRMRTSAEEVKTKIKTLRSQYTTEKAMMSKSSEEAMAPYEPKLWCFNSLRFLDDHVKMRSTATATSNQSEGAAEFVQTIRNSTEVPAVEAVVKVEPIEKPTIKVDEKPFRWMRDVENLATFRVSQIKAKMAKKAEEKKLELLSKVHQDALEYKRDMTVKEEDQHDIFGKYVASELRQITDQQIYFRTKRAIQDALTDGQESMLFGQVTSSTMYCTIDSDNSSLEPVVTSISPSQSDHDN